jgi:hypothetical protein
LGRIGLGSAELGDLRIVARGGRLIHGDRRFDPLALLAAAAGGDLDSQCVPLLVEHTLMLNAGFLGLGPFVVAILDRERRRAGALGLTTYAVVNHEPGADCDHDPEPEPLAVTTREASLPRQLAGENDADDRDNGERVLQRSMLQHVRRMPHVDDVVQQDRESAAREGDACRYCEGAAARVS